MSLTKLESQKRIEREERITKLQEEKLQIDIEILKLKKRIVDQKMKACLGLN